MSIYKFSEKRMTLIPQSTFQEVGITEVGDLQPAIAANVSILDDDLFVLSEEFSQWDESKRRIDILCIDKNANLVVVELKRTTDGGHMELQALRYAAMISSMTFGQALEAHKKYCNAKGIEEEPESRILTFLGYGDNRNDLNFAQKTRIILVSADFSKEITTTVLWLNSMSDLEIQCIKISPYKDADELYIDVQHIIPLREAEFYLTKLKEKEQEERRVQQESTRDYSKYYVEIMGVSETNLNKRGLVKFILDEFIDKHSIAPEQLAPLKYKCLEGAYDSREYFIESYKIENKQSLQAKRWYNKVYFINNKSYIFWNNHTRDIEDDIKMLFKNHPQLNAQFQNLS